jgi:hypothetical protein
MLNYLEIESKLIHMADAVKAQVLYDMRFDVNFYEFYSLKFQKETQIQEFLKRYS